MRQTFSPPRAVLRNVLLAAMALAGCAVPAAKEANAPARPDFTEVVVTANKLASEAGLAMLKRGGAPIDAAVAAQAVLGLVEPQSSGPGGGSVLLLWQAEAGKLSVIDGTPRAGRNAAAGLNTGPSGEPVDPASAMYGGAAVGVPGTLPALWAAHRAHGKLPWAELFAPAIKLADDGFAMPQALYKTLTAPGAAQALRDLAALYGPVLPQPGAMVRNPAYAAALRRIAKDGPKGLWEDGKLQEALGRGLQRSRLTRADFEHYTVAQPEPLCAPWQQWRICTAPPPISGGLVALQILAMTGPGDIAEAGFAHRFLEAGRLAEADRRRYVADPDQVPVPVRAMLDPAYLAMRAGLIAPDRAMHQPRAGVLPVTAAEADPGLPTTATSQIAIAARNGDALSMTTSLTHIFGARVVADGMALNNALVNFAPLPPSGVRYANEMAPGKRPATPMAPVMVFDAQGEPVLLGGSGGGPGVPDYTAAALLDLLTGGRTPAQAVARGHISSAETDHVAVEAGTEAAALLPALEAMGHQAAAEPLPSGSAFLLRTATGWQGAADPRRDGVALGN